MNNVNEAIGITRAAAATARPFVLSFTVETDGRLPTGDPLGAAIEVVDAATEGYPAYYMINCAHPTHFATTLDEETDWVARIRHPGECIALQPCRTRRDDRAGCRRSEEHTSELQSLMRISYAVFCLKKKQENQQNTLI